MKTIAWKWGAWKRGVFFALLAVTMVLGAAHGARAEMPQTDVELVKRMAGADNDKIIDALELYYALHVSELTVQYLTEERTAAFFAVRDAEAGERARLRKKAEDISGERSARVSENEDLRAQLGELSGVDFSEPLVMAPDAPLDQPKAPSGAPAALIRAQASAWDGLVSAQTAWRDARFALLDAQQRYDETRDVALVDFLNGMTLAEIKLAEAVGRCRLVEAKIAAATDKNLADALAAL